MSALVKAALEGQVVSFPTDTVPALAVRPTDAPQIFKLKNRPANKPLILMAAEPDQLWQLAAGSDTEREAWQALAAQGWPGPLTLVLPCSSAVPDVVNPGLTSIGLRIPDHPIALKILQQTGPLATTSANVSGEAPLLDPLSIEAAFPAVQVLAWEQSEQAIHSGLPSTVVEWQGVTAIEGKPSWRLLRQGAFQLPSE
ncbi:L-threonylcarbamoyladenylate synthase [Leptolyngbya sp. FACHB-261]|uniref:L-threonylcarbamoyladenylate synthase n=1 Tax=Leptolyngbya sp. FACHB-261 TaxID=2692806 RepID=UPI001F5588E7|nr:L-threonylcarbamoyladenylate synthase [Leptolyngbya sp. FACHB-261]